MRSEDIDEAFRKAAQKYWPERKALGITITRNDPQCAMALKDIIWNAAKDNPWIAFDGTCVALDISPSTLKRWTRAMIKAQGTEVTVVYSITRDNQRIARDEPPGKNPYTKKIPTDVDIFDAWTDAPQRRHTTKRVLVQHWHLERADRYRKSGYTERGAKVGREEVAVHPAPAPAEVGLGDFLSLSQPWAVNAQRQIVSNLRVNREGFPDVLAQGGALLCLTWQQALESPWEDTSEQRRYAALYADFLQALVLLEVASNDQRVGRLVALQDAERLDITTPEANHPTLDSDVCPRCGRAAHPGKRCRL